MVMQKIKHGFTIIELVTVMAIVSILAAVAVAAYSSFGTDKYDAEAMAHMTSIYEQTMAHINEWGVLSGTGTDNYKLAADNYDLGPAKGGCEFTSANIDNFKNGANNNALNIREVGSTHWRYRVAVGFVNDSTMEGVIVSAHRNVGNHQRVLFMGAGIDTPIVACTGEVACAFVAPINVDDTKGNGGTNKWSANYAMTCNN